MQESIRLKLSEEQQELLKKDPDYISDFIKMLVPVYADRIGYMLQAYHPRQKVSKVEIIPGTMQLNGINGVGLQLAYLLEEFSACSAVDTEDKEKMPVTVTVEDDGAALSLTGEYWPSLD